MLFIAVALLSSSAFAIKNPLIRACSIEAGQFWVVKEKNQDYALCFFGDVAIGAEALFFFKSKSRMPESVLAYKNRTSSSARGGICGSYDAESLQGKDTKGEVFNLCVFSDGSLIEETTLWLGPGSPSTQALDKALSSTY